MTIETEVDFARGLERLRRRDTGSLAAFILSLAQDSGPVGEQVRTFIVGDVVAEAVEALRVRIKGAAELIERAATSLPRADVVAALVPLMGDDGYGLRSALADVIASREVIP